MTAKEAFTTIIKDGGKITSPTSELTPDGAYIKRATEGGHTSLYIYGSNDELISQLEGGQMKKVTDWIEKV